MHLDTDIKEKSARGTAVTDPVCRMTVHPDSAAGSFEYKGETYYFCSPHCQHKFEEDPGRFSEQDCSPAGGTAGWN